MLDNSVSGSEMAGPASDQSYDSSEDDSYNNLVIDEDGYQIGKSNAASSDENEELVSQNVKFVQQNQEFVAENMSDSINTVKVNIQGVKQETAQNNSFDRQIGQLNHINQGKYLQISSPDTQQRESNPIKSLESVVNNLIRSQIDSDSNKDIQLNRNNNNNVVSPNFSYSHQGGATRLSPNHFDQQKSVNLHQIGINAGKTSNFAIQRPQMLQPVNPVVITPVVNVTSQHSTVVSTSYSAIMTSPLTSPTGINYSITTSQQPLKLRNEGHNSAFTAVNFTTTNALTSPTMSVKSTATQPLKLKNEHHPIPPSTSPLSGSSNFSPSYAVTASAMYPGMGLQGLGVSGLASPGLQGVPVPGVMAPYFNQPAMSPAMMTKTSPVISPPPTTTQHSHHRQHTEAPLDLTTSTKRPLVTERSVNEAPIDLAPKRKKTEQSEVYLTPKKPAPLRPTPVASPNWYSNCLSKLATSVNNTNVKFQKSSAFTPVSTGSKNTNPQSNRTGSGIPQSTTGSTNPQSTGSGVPGSMMPFGMISPFAMGMDPLLLQSMMFNPLLMASAMGNPAGFPPGMMSSAAGFPGMTMSSSLRDTLFYQQKVVQNELSDLCQKADPMSAIHAIQQQYSRECQRIEQERNKALETANETTAHKDSVNAYYDNQLYVCVSYTKTQVEQEMKSFEMGGRLKPDGSNNLLSVPGYNNINSVCVKKEKTSPIHTDSKTTPPNQNYYSRTKQPHSISPIHSSTPQVKSSVVSPSNSSNHRSYSSMIHSPDGSSENSSNESGFLDSSDISPNDSAVRGNRRFLSNHAISVLSEWYDTHSDHPYPDEDDVELLSKAANISDCQVKKWMANKRVRSCNTLAFNGSIHPKKLQKLLQLKEAGVDSDENAESSSSSSNSNQNIPNAVANQYGGLLNQVNVSNGQVIFKNGERSIVIPHKPSRKQKAKRLLDPKAVEVMNTWYLEHIDYPYPTDDEKQQLADENGLSVAQVTCWFANKRNRSNNTRKMTPQSKYRKSAQNSPQIPVGMVTTPFPGFPGQLAGFPMPGMMG